MFPDHVPLCNKLICNHAHSRRLLFNEPRTHQRSVARVVLVDRTGSGGVHVAEQVLDLPQGDSASAVRHLEDKEKAARELFCSCGSKLAESPILPPPPPTLMVRSSHPRDTRTLMGGSVRLVSWVSTVALMAFWWRTYTVWSHVTWKSKTCVHVL